MIEQIIRTNIHLYKKDMNRKSAYQINNGLCEEFATDVLEDLGGDSDDSFELTTEDFSDEWGIIQPEFKSVYGNLPHKVKKEIELPYHVWIFHKGKHYDAEKPEGVKNFFNLPVFKRSIEKQI